jgi:methyl acetate hydrolase
MTEEPSRRDVLVSATAPGPNGRSAGSLTWAGLYNTYFWIDPKRRVAGMIMTQILPFADTRALALCGRFERGIYDAQG